MQRLEPGIGGGMQMAGERLKVRLRLLAIGVGAVEIDGRWRGVSGG
jgi:hypothetical protein